MACESMLVPACCRMFSFVNLVISDAMSTSRIRDSDAVRFSWYVARLFRRCSRRFCTAPKFARAVETFLIALSIVEIAPTVLPLERFDEGLELYRSGGALKVVFAP